jgi:hypothetical protein
MLAIVAPVSMGVDAQDVFLQSAVSALDKVGIRADEVAAVAPEVICKISRHQQIVSTISELVSDKRSRSRGTGAGGSWYDQGCPRPVNGKVTTEMMDWLNRKEGKMTLSDIELQAQQRRREAKTEGETAAAYHWENDARRDSGYKPL